ncbi:hypothetical protein GCM10029964_091850 [Kibdelosporangium lantanae]
MHGFLVALGVTSARIPADLDARTALYRSTIADKRMLIVLDNAATTDQVEPLLPGTATCTVLITCRKKLATLITRYGARHLQLNILTHDEAHALLTKRLGPARVSAEPNAADELIRLCGRYTLALAIMAQNAHTRPHIPLAEFTAELRDLGLDALDNDDPAASLANVLSWSLRGLTIEQRTVFALLGIAPGPDIGLPAAISLTDLPARHIIQALNALEEASLVARQPNHRYAMHDVIRHYAATLAHQHLGEGLRETALRRVLDFYTHTAHAADRLLDPHNPFIRLDPPAPEPYPHLLPDAPAAMAWFDTERANLLAAQHTAVTHGWHHTVWKLAWTLDTFHNRRGHRHDQLAMRQAALDAVAHLPDRTARIRAHRLLGRACADLRHHEEAIGHLHQALTLAESGHDPTEQAHTHWALGKAWEQQGDIQRALDHSTRALDFYRTLDQQVWEAEALNEVGWCAARLGDYDTGRTHCRAALPLHQHHNYPEGEAATLGNLGYIEHHTGHHRRAIRYYQQALTLFRNIDHTHQMAITLERLGHPHTALGHHTQAHAVWREALQLYHEQGRDNDAERVQRQLDTLDHRPRRGESGTSPRSRWTGPASR